MLKKQIRPRKKTIHNFKRSAESFKRKLRLKTRAGLSMRSTKRYQRLTGGPAFRRKFRRKYRG